MDAIFSLSTSTSWLTQCCPHHFVSSNNHRYSPSQVNPLCSYSLSFRIASGWNDLFALLIHSSSGDQSKDMFQNVIEQIDTSLFSSPMSSEDSAPKFQRIFCGFRVMVQLLGFLKLESLRSNPSPYIEDFLIIYCTRLTAFAQQLLSHSHGKFRSLYIRDKELVNRTSLLGWSWPSLSYLSMFSFLWLGSPPTPLQQAAQTCLSFLSQLAHGLPASRFAPNPSKRHKKKDLATTDIDIVGAGVCSSLDLSLIDDPVDGGVLSPASQTRRMITFYTCPIAVREDVWVRGAKAFVEACQFTLLHSSSLMK